MRWVEKKDATPKHGDIRYRYIFAWKKTRVKQFIVWLETYVIKEQFFEPSSGMSGWWTETERDIL